MQWCWLMEESGGANWCSLVAKRRVVNQEVPGLNLAPVVSSLGGLRQATVSVSATHLQNGDNNTHLPYWVVVRMSTR